MGNLITTIIIIIVFTAMLTQYCRQVSVRSRKDRRRGVLSGGRLVGGEEGMARVRESQVCARKRTEEQKRRHIRITLK